MRMTRLILLSFLTLLGTLAFRELPNSDAGTAPPAAAVIVDSAPSGREGVCVSAGELFWMGEVGRLGADRYDRLQQVHKAMQAIATTKWPHDLDKLMRRWKQPYTSWDFARFFLKHADANGLDPLVLVAITWKESKFKAIVKGDHLRGKARSCGCTQVRTDIKGRPKCAQLLDPDFAIGWTAKHLARFPGLCKGVLCLNKYNRGEYEVKIWRTVDFMRRALLTDRPVPVGVIQAAREPRAGREG